MKNLLINLVISSAIFTANPLLAMDPSEGDKTSIHCNSDKSVFWGESEIKGTRVFFGMEKIRNEGDLQNWKNYKGHVYGVECLYKHLKESITEGKEISLNDTTWDELSMKFLTGMSSEAEFQTYLGHFKEFMKDEGSLKVATRVSKGLEGFTPKIKIGAYVVYSSKKPVSGKHLFPSDFGKFSPLTALETYCSDLIMVVCSRNDFDHSNKSLKAFENRGVHRVPVSCFNDGKKYSGGSLKLHAFSALCRQSFSSIDYLYVDSAYGMTKVLVEFDHWQKGEFILRDKDILDCTLEEKKPRVADTPCLINVAALTRIWHDNFVQ